QQNQPISPQNYLIFGPEKDGDFYSLYSKLEVSVEDWQRGDVFGCVVGHDGIPLNFIHKSIDKNAGKASHVNVSVVLSDADVTCY
ncbi:hypothetical protein L9G74_20195, partial [Shewanella sp. C32]